VVIAFWDKKEDSWEDFGKKIIRKGGEIMAKICEYENIHCPYCGSEKVEHREYGFLEYRNSPKVKVHIIGCPDCLGEFAITCAD